MQDCAIFLAHNMTRNVMMQSSTYDDQMNAMEQQSCLATASKTIKRMQQDVAMDEEVLCDWARL